MTNKIRISRRRLLSSTAAGMVTAGVAGLPMRSVAQTRRGGALRVSVDQGASQLNPLLHRVNPEYLLGEMLYSGLTRLNPDMTPEPDLAVSWEASDDLAEWTFHLRER